MAYRVLSRRYRPKTFEELIGQSHVTRTLSNAIRDARVGHAYLFTGPRGVGKTTVARLLAKSLNCEKGPTSAPCNVCPSCIEIDESRSMDVYEIDGASNTGVDNIREIKNNVQYSPSRDRYKIYIIDEVHMLSQGAFNALLKTLEEPPDHVVFIFATTEPHKVPLTVQSRCQRFDFRKLRSSMILQSLNTITAQEGIMIDDESRDIIARYSQGSLRDAQSLLEQAIAYSGKNITHDEIYKALGILERDVLIKAVNALSSHDIAEATIVAREVDARGYDPKRFTEELLAVLRDAYLLTQSLGDLVELPEAEIITLKKLSNAFTAEDIINLMNTVAKSIELISRSTQPGMALEVVLIKAASLKPIFPIDQILSDLKKLKNNVKDTSNAFMTKPTNNESNQDNVITYVKENHEEEHFSNNEKTTEGFIQQIYQVNGSIAVALKGSKIDIEKDRKICITYKQEDNALFSKEKNGEFIKSMIKNYFGINYEMELKIQQRHEAASKNLEERDPKLHTLLDVLGAKIIKKT